MTAVVIRRVARVAAPPRAPAIEVPKIVALTLAEERERLVRTRARQRHGEVLGEFRNVGALVDWEAR